MQVLDTQAAFADRTFDIRLTGEEILFLWAHMRDGHYDAKVELIIAAPLKRESIELFNDLGRLIPPDLAQELDLALERP